MLFKLRLSFQLVGFLQPPPKWCSYSTVWLLHGWCHIKLLPSQHTFCVHHTTMHQFTMPPYSKPHTYGASVFSCDLPPVLLAGCLGSFGRMTGIFYVLLWGVEWILSQKWAQKVDPQEEDSHTTPVSTQTCYLLIMSPVLYHWAIHTPQSINYMCTQNLPYCMLNQCLYFFVISTNIAQNSL